MRSGGEGGVLAMNDVVVGVILGRFPLHHREWWKMSQWVSWERW